MGERMEHNTTQEIIDCAELWHDAMADLQSAEIAANLAIYNKNMLVVCDAQASLASQKGETLRAACALLRAVAAYRADDARTFIG